MPIFIKNAYCPKRLFLCYLSTFSLSIGMFLGKLYILFISFSCVNAECPIFYHKAGHKDSTLCYIVQVLSSPSAGNSYYKVHLLFWLFEMEVRVNLVISCIMCRDGVAFDRLVGFQDLGGVDDFSTSTLESWLLRKGTSLILIKVLLFP